jgi:hypothetical protein
MPLLTVVLVLLVVGVLLALINYYGPPYVDAKFLRLINIVVVVAAVIWLLKVFGVWAYLSTITV